MPNGGMFRKPLNANSDTLFFNRLIFKSDTEMFHSCGGNVYEGIMSSADTLPVKPLSSNSAFVRDSFIRSVWFVWS